MELLYYGKMDSDWNYSVKFKIWNFSLKIQNRNLKNNFDQNSIRKVP